MAETTFDRLLSARKLLFYQEGDADLSLRIEQEKEIEIKRILILAAENTLTPDKVLRRFLSDSSELAVTAARVLYRRGCRGGEVQKRLQQAILEGSDSEATEALGAIGDTAESAAPEVVQAARQRLERERESGDPAFQSELLSWFAPRPWSLELRRLRLHPDLTAAKKRLHAAWSKGHKPHASEFSEDLWVDSASESHKKVIKNRGL